MTRVLASGGGRCSLPAHGCEATYWSVRVGGVEEQDLVWSYWEPRREAKPIGGLLAFFNERVDLEVDGELQERPETPWSRPQRRVGAKLD